MSSSGNAHATEGHSKPQGCVSQKSAVVRRNAGIFYPCSHHILSNGGIKGKPLGKSKHAPLITKALFEQTRERIKSERAMHYDSKEFAFTKLMRCKFCGSGVTAQEKFKKLKSGGFAKYVYYGCTRSKDLYCKSGYIREEELVTQLLNLIGAMTIDELGLRRHLKEEIERHERFNTMLGMKTEKVKLHDADLKNYARHTLNNGTPDEKRMILVHLRDHITLGEKVIAVV